MQTFLPYDDFRRTAEVLDQKRLGKQRVECIQVLRGLTRPGYGWRHHPAVKMWRGHEEALGRYAYTCCERWVSLGFGDTCAATIAASDTSTPSASRSRTSRKPCGVSMKPGQTALQRMPSTANESATRRESESTAAFVTE